MSRKKKKKEKRQPAKSSKPKPLNNPFLEAAKELKKTVNRPPEPPPPPPAPDEIPLDDLADFKRAMAEVTPLDHGRDPARPSQAPPPRPAENEDLEVLAHLADLVSGEADLDVRDTDEYVEGSQPGLYPEVMAKLTQGLFPVHAHLDLHGLTVAEAEIRVTDFLAESRRKDHRTVLIIHGRGRGSPQGRPVLKTHLVAWLSRSGLRKYVLAFCTARPYDGGAGAMYVLLKG